MTTTTADLSPAKGDHSLERLLLFSDGVFAIAITLLAIELHVPEGWNGQWASLWAERWPMFTAFALSFAIIGVFWNTHRRVFARMTGFSNGVMLFNMLALAGVVLMPFATTMLYEQPRNGEGAWIYLSLVALVGVMHAGAYGWAAFVTDAIRPRPHWAVRATVVVTHALMPGLACALSFFLMARGVGLLAAVTALALGLLIAGRVWVGRRFGGAA